MCFTQLSQNGPLWLTVAAVLLVLVMIIGPAIERRVLSVPTQAPPPPAGGDPAYPPLSRKRRCF
jgi:hypothetical protein